MCERCGRLPTHGTPGPFCVACRKDLRDGFVWHAREIGEEVFAWVPTDSFTLLGDSTAARARKRERELRRWRSVSQKPFMRRLRHDGALPTSDESMLTGKEFYR